MDPTTKIDEKWLVFGNLVRENLEYHAKVGIEKYLLTNSKLTIEEISDIVSKELICRIRFFLNGKVIKRPKDWWEALKERFAPNWFIEKYPIIYEEFSIPIICPHTAYESRDVHKFWTFKTYKSLK